jgi:AmmeMemoRadiSam system protein A
MSEHLSVAQGRKLLQLARQVLEQRLRGGPAPVVESDPQLESEGAAFVTLKIDGKLRGCIGNLTPVSSLWQGVRDNALNAAFNDHRFQPLAEEELSKVELDISVLSAPEPVDYDGPEDLLAKLNPGVDGIILKDGRKGATFLPQVWQQLPSPAQFLEHLCIKAGLDRDIWKKKKLEIQRYRVRAFKEEQG